MTEPKGTDRAAQAIEAYKRAHAHEDEPRRLTPTERLHEVTMAYAQRAPSQPEHSVTISRNARGVVQFEVTVRGFDVPSVVHYARTHFDSLAAQFPYPDANGGTE